MTVLGRSRAKVRSWLLGLSEKIVHYGNVFDVLVQHHPEYVSLAWGTFKLVFTVSLIFPKFLSTASRQRCPKMQKAITNHAENASKLAKALDQIANLLPQHSLLLILYPTPQMQLSVARLYTHIMNFFLSSLKWYKEHRAKHVLTALLQPWDLKFKEGFNVIASEAQQIRQLADVAMKSELRTTRQGVELVMSEVRELKGKNQRLQRLVEDRFDLMEESVMCEYIL
jgi:hypothetical protein